MTDLDVLSGMAERGRALELQAARYEARIAAAKAAALTLRRAGEPPHSVTLQGHDWAVAWGDLVVMVQIRAPLEAEIERAQAWLDGEAYSRFRGTCPTQPDQPEPREASERRARAVREVRNPMPRDGSELQGAIDRAKVEP